MRAKRSDAGPHLPVAKDTFDQGQRGRLHPGRRRAINTEVPRFGHAAAWTGTASRLLRLARQVSRAVGPSQSKGGFSSRQFQRRAIVNVRYANSRVKGGWKAHGRYVERESAAGRAGQDAADRLGLADDHALDELAAEWQAAGDERLFKIIISPEDGQVANFHQVSAEMISTLEKQVGSRLRWAGVVHRNTDHTHAHLIVRGVKDDGSPLTIPRGVVKTQLRQAVQDSLTRQLGFRTLDDVQREKQVEVTAFRVTSIDRSIAKQITRTLGSPELVTPMNALEERRLKTLEKMGLANRVDAGWQLRRDFQKQLQQMKDLQDRARTLFRSGVAISDPHAPMEYIERSRKLIGRVLLTSEDEKSGQLQTAFETIDGKIVIAKHDAPLRGAWARGDLKPGNLVAIEGLKRDPEHLYASSLGTGKDLLRDEKALDHLARRISNMSLILADNKKGWMGELARALAGLERSPAIEL